MAYQALYRQWRPQNFTSMVGQEDVVATLRNQVTSGRIAHAYLFCGSRGTGKTSTAKILSRAVNCQSPIDGDPCGECENCKRLMQDESLDVMQIDAASNNGVDDIRDLRDTVQYPPQYGKYKVYIIDEVHMLSVNAFNALLKTLEEPPAYVLFILATTQPQKLPATILSRCQRFDFGRIPAWQIAGRLREAADASGTYVTDGALQMVARAAQGGMRDALSILDMCLGYGKDVDEDLVHSVLGTADRSFLFRFADALQKQDAAGVMRLIDELIRSGHEPDVFAKDVSAHLRALLIALCAPQDMVDLLELTQEDTQTYVAQAELFTKTRLMNMMELFMGVESDLRWSSSPRMALQNAALKACLRTNETDTSALVERIGILQKTIEDLNAKLASGTYSTVAVPAEGHIKAKQQQANQEAQEPKAKPVEGKPKQIWKEFMRRFSESNPFDFAMLTLGKLIDAQGDIYRWMPDDGSQARIAMLNNEVRRNAIAQALSSLTGKECRFEAVAKASQAKQAQAQNGDEFLKALQESFGSEHVVVQQDGNEH